MLIKAIGFFLLSSVKFAVAVVPIAVSFNYIQSLIISISGGITGAFFFLYLWSKALLIWNVYVIKKDTEPVKPFKITKKKRRIVKIKNTYGYWGIIITTPIILSIPLGAFLLIQYFKHRKYKFFHLCLFIALWGIVLISFLELFNFDFRF